MKQMALKTPAAYCHGGGEPVMDRAVGLIPGRFVRARTDYQTNDTDTDASTYRLAMTDSSGSRFEISPQSITFAGEAIESWTRSEPARTLAVTT
jgi:hypothetical protein